VGGTQISSLLSPQQLKAWIDNGYRDERGNRVVIFDGSSPANYNAGHIPGSYNVSFNTDFTKTRSDGPMMVALMVADGPQMDGLVQKYGIDGNTTVVVFTGDAMIWSARGYWTFRYWGFPQNRLFVLNGKSTTANSVWTAANYTLTTEVPALPTPSTFSVSSLSGNVDQVRAPLDEMMNVASGKVPGSVIIDSRNETEWTATVGATFARAMEYRWNNSVWRPYELEFAGTNVGDPYATIALASAGSQVLKSKDELLAEWAAAGFTQDKKLYST
jgi:3-mercaptopyruvate sulfurtransferase SseA